MLRAAVVILPVNFNMETGQRCCVSCFALAPLPSRAAHTALPGAWGQAVVGAPGTRVGGADGGVCA